jgi:hypothetical protein
MLDFDITQFCLSGTTSVESPETTPSIHSRSPSTLQIPDHKKQILDNQDGTTTIIPLVQRHNDCVGNKFGRSISPANDNPEESVVSSRFSHISSLQNIRSLVASPVSSSQGNARGFSSTSTTPSGYTSMNYNRSKSDKTSVNNEELRKSIQESLLLYNNSTNKRSEV